MARAEYGGIGRVFSLLMITVVILALGGVVIYLLSHINHRKYRINVREGHLVVERGRMLPFGFEVYVPDAEALRRAYAPIEAPADADIDAGEEFQDRADIDRTLFALLAGWARAGLASDDTDDIERGMGYIERSEMLHGLSEEQRVELRTLRADLAYRNGRRILGEILSSLRAALAEFELALQLGTSRPTDAKALIVQIERRIAAHEESGSVQAEKDDLPGLPLVVPPPSPGETAPIDPPTQTDKRPWRL